LFTLTLALSLRERGWIECGRGIGTPSPWPSPSGRGDGSSAAGRVFSLSLRERVGVRVC